MTFDFVIRDDDINYFTDVSELETAYASLPNCVPVSFAVVPFHGCTKTPAIPKKHWEGNEQFPIGGNKHLISYLNKKIEDNSATVMLHGYNHVKYSGRAEFVAGNDLHARVNKGKEYLESLFEVDVSIFVPPNNSFSRRGLNAIKKSGLHTFYYPTPINRPKHPSIIFAFLRDLLFKYNHKKGGPWKFVRDANRFWRKKERSIFMPVQPQTYTMQNIEEFTCVSMTRDASIEPIKKQMEIADQYNAQFCLAVHYHSFRSDEFRDSFYRLIDYAYSNLNPRFIRAEKMFK